MSYSITINYNSSAKTYASEYIYASTNPGEIEAGGSATLVFKADGEYFQLYKAASKAFTVSGATLVSWSCVSPFVTGTLVISNPTENVTITINPRQLLTPIELSTGFRFNTNAASDSRTVLTKHQMLSMNKNSMPENYFCVCKDDGKLYIWSKLFTQSSETGYFKPYEEVIDLPEAIVSAMSTTAGKDAMEEAVSTVLPGAIGKVMADETAAETLCNNMFDSTHFQVNMDQKIDLAISVIQAIDGN